MTTSITGENGAFISSLLQCAHFNYAMLISSQPLPPPHLTFTLTLSFRINLRLWFFLILILDPILCFM